MEIWKPIKYFEGYYEVSNLGRIRSLAREIINCNGKKIHLKGKILKSNKHPEGYILVYLSKNSKSKTFRVHRLVAEAFISNPDNKPCIDHINCIRDDNRAENLRWVTHSENNNNPLTKENMSESQKGKHIGENNHFYGKTHSEETRKIMSEKGKDNRANMRPVINLDTGEIFISIRRACEKYPHILPTHITRVCKGKRKRTGGYRWAYYEEVV